jgi:3',5'-nucleoside bisphosphate phosphatase
MHTIFSDGDVWPTVRVQEAYMEGLDVIAITDHIERNPSKKFVGGDDNSAYEIACPRPKSTISC